MTVQLSTAVRNARVAAIESTIGTAAKVQLRTGAPPANPAAADSGTLLAEFNLASDWATQSGGVLTFSGSPPGSVAASAAGTAAHYRVKDSGGTTCHMQGTVTATGGGGDMTIDNPVLASGQTVQITSWTITDGNA